MSNLRWEKKGTWWSAELGDPGDGDGVRFSLEHRPSCYRRGPFLLKVEVASGPGHELWGCFDEQDQPVRNFHDAGRALDEADAIASVLWTDRIRREPPPKETASATAGPLVDLPPASVACPLHARTCKACSEHKVFADAVLAHNVLLSVTERRDGLEQHLGAIGDAWVTFASKNDLQDLVGVEELSRAVGGSSSC